MAFIDDYFVLDLETTGLDPIFDEIRCYAVIEYECECECECEEDISLQFYSKRRLDAEPIHGNSAMGFIMSPDEPAGKLGLKLEAGQIGSYRDSLRIISLLPYQQPPVRGSIPLFSSKNPCSQVYLVVMDFLCYASIETDSDIYSAIARPQT